MQRAQAIVSGFLGGGAGQLTKPQVVQLQLSGGQANALAAALRDDAKSYYFNGCTSLLDGLLSIHRGLSTWPTVKWYYSVFYALRALLAIAGHSTFYVQFGQKASPFQLSATPGSVPSGLSGTTHAAVLKMFRAHHQNHWLLSQQIAGLDPLQWLMDKREDANYRSQFSEPTTPDYMRKLFESGPRRLIAEYVADDDGIYVFDPDHAILAYPLRVLTYCRQALATANVQPFPDSLSAFLGSICVDPSGRLTKLAKLIG